MPLFLIGMVGAVLAVIALFFLSIAWGVMLALTNSHRSLTVPQMAGYEAGCQLVRLGPWAMILGATVAVVRTRNQRKGW